MGYLAGLQIEIDQTLVGDKPCNELPPMHADRSWYILILLVARFLRVMIGSLKSALYVGAVAAVDGVRFD